MDLGNGLGHLTYSTLVHPADDWPQLWDSLKTYLPQVKQRVSPNQPFGVCIRLSHLTAAELSSKQAEREKLKAFLKDQDLYVYTANAFVYGVFKNTQIKEQVYEPDWRTPERREYTKQVADILADVCPACGHALDPDRAARLQAARDRPRRRRRLHRQRPAGLRAPGADRADDRQAAHAGPRAGAALPSGDDRRDDRVLPGPSLHRQGRRARGPARPHSDGHGDQRAAPPPRRDVRHRPSGRRLRRHPGVAAEAGRRGHPDREAPGSRLDVHRRSHRREDRGAAALHQDDLSLADGRVPRRPPRALPESRRRDGRLGDRQDAAAVAHALPRAGLPHGPGADAVDAVRARSRRWPCTRQTPLSRHLEIETYTWDVLPDHLKTGDIVEYVCRELEWVRAQLA